MQGPLSHASARANAITRAKEYLVQGILSNAREQASRGVPSCRDPCQTRRSARQINHFVQGNPSRASNLFCTGARAHQHVFIRAGAVVKEQLYFKTLTRFIRAKRFISCFVSKLNNL